MVPGKLENYKIRFRLEHTNFRLEHRNFTENILVPIGIKKKSRISDGPWGSNLSTAYYVFIIRTSCFSMKMSSSRDGEIGSNLTYCDL